MHPDQRRSGDEYRLTEADIQRFRDEGWVHLRGVLDESEVAQLEVDYERFLRGEIPVPGKDFCDMSGDYGRDPQSFAILNVMLPRRYHPAWRGNVLERRAASIARQLQGDGLAIDYDQLLAKRPNRPDAVFGWHQDQAYWPLTTDPRTATIWLALDDSTIENGCMRFVSGTHRGPLRRHRPLHADREESHALVADVDEAVDVVECAQIRRGDVTVHDERVLHGSGGNSSPRWRRAYIVALRSESTIAEERALGFTHSHEDPSEVLAEIARRAALARG
jgi:hypothetical protein